MISNSQYHEQLIEMSALELPIITRTVRQAKIVGGSLAEKGEFPHQVALSYQNEFICGGSILTSLLILTACHCVKYRRPNRLQVIAGLHDQTGVLDGSNEYFPITGDEQIRTTRYIYMHENYVWDTDINDIAIIVLNSPLQYNSHVKNISLPKENEVFKGYATVSGWGRTEEKGKISEKLRKVKLPIVDLENCRRRYKKLRYKITDNMLCAGESGRDACQGDSGGPLICKRNDSTLVQCGIVSFGHGCGRAGFPGIYTNLANYIDWIEETKNKINARGKCRTDHFYCSSGPGCIPRTFLCDLDSDCNEDGEDERGCIYMTSCRRGQFRCNNGRCIKKEYTCDDMDDCGDRSDEDKCPTESKICVEGQHQCGTGGRCIPEEWKCDREQDCDDNSDEEDCAITKDSENEIIAHERNRTTTPPPCSSDQFYCSRDYRCIPLRWRCDGDRDCRSGADEIGCENDNEDTASDNDTTTTERPTTMPFTIRSTTSTPTTTSTSLPIIDVSTTAGTHSETSSMPTMAVIDTSSLSSSSVTNSSCSPDDFHCGNGECISSMFHCDYNADCEDATDEKDCHLVETTCTPYFWRCGNGECIYHRFKCDNDFDCSDGTDELNCELIEAMTTTSATEANSNGQGRRRRRRRRGKSQKSRK